MFSKLQKTLIVSLLLITLLTTGCSAGSSTATEASQQVKAKLN